MSEENKQFESGAVRSKDADKTRYDLISPIALRRLAETCAEGAERYGDYNWLKGFPMSDVMNHCLRHLNLYMSGDTTEDHLTHSLWNIMALIHFEETRPDLMDIPSRVNSVEHTVSDDCCNADYDCVSVSSEVDDEDELWDECVQDWQEAREEFDWRKLQEEHDLMKGYSPDWYLKLKEQWIAEEDRMVCRCDEELY